MPRHSKIRRQHNSEGYFPVTYWLLCGLNPDEATSAPDPEETPSALETAAPETASAQAAPGTPEKKNAAKNPRTPSAPRTPQAPPLESGASADAQPQVMPAADAHPRQSRRSECPKGTPSRQARRSECPKGTPSRQARRSECPKGTPSRQARRAKCLKGIPCVAGCMMSERHNAPGFRPPGGKCLKDTLSNISPAISKNPT